MNICVSLGMANIHIHKKFQPWIIYQFEVILNPNRISESLFLNFYNFCVSLIELKIGTQLIHGVPNMW
jgi:hypothetical protein